jgi:hypothetical protein
VVAIAVGRVPVVLLDDAAAVEDDEVVAPPEGAEDEEEDAAIAVIPAPDDEPKDDDVPLSVHVGNDLPLPFLLLLLPDGSSEISISSATPLSSSAFAPEWSTPDGPPAG